MVTPASFCGIIPGVKEHSSLSGGATNAKRIFDSPEEAEAAFYDAIERGDIEALGDVWSRDENIVCIHPGSSRIEGRREVLESFIEMFVDSPSLGFSITDALQTGSDGLVVHLVREEIELDGQVVSVMVATNIYHREDGGWRMLLHHSSYEPDLTIDDEFDDDDDDDDEFMREQSPPPVLH